LRWIYLFTFSFISFALGFGPGGFVYRKGASEMKNYAKQLEALGLSQVQIVTILSGWPSDSIERLLRGQATPPSDTSISDHS